MATEDTLIGFYNLQAVLEEYAKNAAEIYGKNVALGGKRASGSLIDTVKGQVVTTSGGYEVTLSLNEYWKYVEGGTQGKESSPAGAIYAAHLPPPSAIEAWINVKPILPRRREDGSIPSPADLSWAIAKRIEQRGIAPHPALAQTIDELNEMYADRLGVALALDCKDYIAKVMPQTGRMSTKL